MASPTPSFPCDPTDPSDLTTEQHFDELAALLAKGARRLARLKETVRQIPPHSEPNGLDVPRQQSVYGVTTPFNDPVKNASAGGSRAIEIPWQVVAVGVRLVPAGLGTAVVRSNASSKGPLCGGQLLCI